MGTPTPLDEALVLLPIVVGVSSEGQRWWVVVDAREEDPERAHHQHGGDEEEAEAVQGPGHAVPVVLLLGREPAAGQWGAQWAQGALSSPHHDHGPHLIVAVFLPHVLDDEVSTVDDGFYVLVELVLARVQRHQTWRRGGQ